MSIGIVKCGCIGSSVLLEYALDERAEREDIVTTIYGTGSKMIEELCERAARRAVEDRHDMYIIVSPNAGLPGPSKARDILIETGRPVIVVTDGAAKNIAKKLDEIRNVGYIIVLADSMIGARREFLDLSEMCMYNSYVLRVLTVCGVYRCIVKCIDETVEKLKKGEEPTLPRIVFDKYHVLEYSGLQNPYALAKAIAAYEIARHVADLTVEACFKLKEWEKYTMIAASAHEMMRTAAMLAEEAREIDKYNDSLLRTPHAKDGKMLTKLRLIEKPTEVIKSA
ncbi:MAG: F420-dependent methylenetetrahydromethanopterin dehydrogenase [Crenarchaeota archaeon]|nr:F420-dependent methylenetetrahydromethanopterin dehydrogenase [Thermoproteota archaeon]